MDYYYILYFNENLNYVWYIISKCIKCNYPLIAIHFSIKNRCHFTIVVCKHNPNEQKKVNKYTLGLLV